MADENQGRTDRDEDFFTGAWRAISDGVDAAVEAIGEIGEEVEPPAWSDALPRHSEIVIPNRPGLPTQESAAEDITDFLEEVWDDLTGDDEPARTAQPVPPLRPETPPPTAGAGGASDTKHNALELWFLENVLGEKAGADEPARSREARTTPQPVAPPPAARRPEPPQRERNGEEDSGHWSKRFASTEGEFTVPEKLFLGFLGIDVSQATPESAAPLPPGQRLPQSGTSSAPSSSAWGPDSRTEHPGGAAPGNLSRIFALSQNVDDRLAVKYQTEVTQRFMRAAGINPGPIDGIPGPKTHAAIQKFLDQNGMTGVEARVGPELLVAIEKELHTNPGLRARMQASVRETLANPNASDDAMSDARAVLKLDGQLGSISYAYEGPFGLHSASADAVGQAAAEFYKPAADQQASLSM